MPHSSCIPHWKRRSRRFYDCFFLLLHELWVHEPLGGAMKKLLLSTVAGAALFAAAPANAADMPLKAPPMVAPYYSWTGCYVGAHTGWGWGRKRGTEQTISPSPKFTAFGFDTSGAVFGGQVGCDYQFAGNWVLGVQGAISGTDINGVGADADPSEA